MNIFGWNKELETGNELIDEQHMQLIIAVNKLLIVRKNRPTKNGESVEDCIQYLEQYIKFHFQAEEAFQVECNYPDYRKHQAQHEHLSTQLRFLIVRLEAADYDDDEVNTFYAFVCDWVRKHIMEEDMRFARYYRSFLDEKEQTQ